MGINWEQDLLQHADGLSRCGWCGRDDDYVRYHDGEWGIPERDGVRLFEKFVLDTFQAGLSWLLILRKRDAFRQAFAGFDPERLAAFSEADVERLMGNAGIVRNRAKVEAAIHNARVLLRHGGPDWFSRRLWDFVDGKPLQPCHESRSQVPDKTNLSEKIAKEMKALGFRFCGPVTVYAFMQAVGMTNDHLVGCHRHEPLLREVKA